MTYGPVPLQAGAPPKADEFRKLVGRLEAWSPGQPVPDAHTIRWLREQELPNTPFLYEGRVPYGIWTHWTKAGGYKSAMAAQLEHAIAYGHRVPGLSWEPARTGSVLVIDPDGTAMESQDRTFKIAAKGSLCSDGSDYRKGGFHEIITIHEPKGATVEERIVWLWQQIARWEAAVGPIPWIRWDTLASLLGSSEKNAYDHAAAALRGLNHRMAAEERVLFLPHHAGKSGEMIGSTAIYGCSNLVTKVVRTKGTCDGTIEVDQKCRGTAPWALAATFAGGTVSLTDRHPVQARHRPGSVARRVADVLVESGPCENAELYEALPGVPQNQVRKAVSRLEEAGQAMRDETSWHVVPKPETWPAGTIGEELAQAAAEAPGPPVPEPRHGPGLFPDSCVAAGEEQLHAPVHVQEPVPELPGGNPAIEKMIETLPHGEGMYPVRRLKPEIKAQLGYEKVCLGGSPNRFGMFPAEPPDGAVLVLDRRAAFFQSAARVWLVPNHLHRHGDLDYHRIVHDNLAGMFQIVAPAWKSDRPSPLGPLVRQGQSVLVPRPVLDRLMDCVRAGLAEEPYILYGLVGKGTETLLKPWASWCVEARRHLSGQELDVMKAQQSQAVSCLRKTDLDSPGPVDRADWQYAIHGHHYAQTSRYVYKALDVGDRVIAYGNTDEIVFGVPAGQDPNSWRPPSMAEHLAKNRYAVKYAADGAAWFADPRRLGG
jgi:hypothetical protein